MRRTGCLFDSILTRENFRLAWLKSIRGKSCRPEVFEFRENLDENLLTLMKSLSEDSFVFGHYETFTIRDPKERIICAAPFPERILHHAIMNVLDPVLESYQIDDSYACRRGKGTQAAVLRAFHCAKSHGHFLKLDVRKYFDSVDHDILKGMIRMRIKDRAVLGLLDRIVDSYSTAPGKGIPIGNLTSQYFANHYLATLDHEIVDRLRTRPWIRYMDDMLCLADSPQRLRAILTRARALCVHELALALKPEILGRCEDGIPFHGYLVKPSGIFLMQKTKERFRKNYRLLSRGFESGALDEDGFADRSTALCAHLELERSRRFRQTVIHGRLLWRQPRESRRQLEEQR